MSLFVDLVFPIDTNKAFTYSVPPELEGTVQLGSRALAPLGKRTAIGFIVSIASSAAIKQLKPIQDVLDPQPIISGELLHLTKWVSEYYFAHWGESLKAALPPGLAKKRTLYIVPNTNITNDVLESTTPKEAEILNLVGKKGKVAFSHLQKQLKTKSLYGTLNSLAKKGYVSILEQSPKPSPKIKTEKFIEITDDAKSRWKDLKTSFEQQSNGKQRKQQLLLLEALLDIPRGIAPVEQIVKAAQVSRSTFTSAVKNGILSIAEREQVRKPVFEMYDEAIGKQHITLTQHQQRALQEIDTAIHKGNFHTFLLHGITGSGKTQVYIDAVRKALELGKSAIVLVPEISLTTQVVRRFQFHFGDRVTVLHSKMSAGERYDSWRLTREGTYSIVIGPRSAVFAPVKNLGVIVVDEEQESSYKQFDQTPRYHARDVAIVRAQRSNAVVVLGSATPSAESYYNALQGKYTLLELPERVDNAKLPQIEIVDMMTERRKKLEQFREERKEEFRKDPAAARLNRRKLELGSISDLLKEKIADRLTKNEGIILLQNRRGFAPFVECLGCGFVEMCDNCNVTLTYHLSKRQLRCHYCGFTKSPPSVCPKCGGREIKLSGVGTQRVEEDIKALFPSSSLVRMDHDTTTRKGSHDAILRKFAEGEYNILLGTQMVAKGLDFSRVTLVGVVSADTQMLLPDFRSAERVFQLLTQVAGRAGRTGALQGEVIIQTSQPQHYSLKHAATHNFQEFYREELKYRQELDYPPFSRIALIEFRGERENEVVRHAERFAGRLKSNKGHFITLGPAPAAIPKLKKNFRWHIVIKNLRIQDPSGKLLHNVLAKTLESYQKSALGKSKRAKVTIDVDPVGMM